MTAHPQFFASATRPLFGWLHLPVTEARRSVGVVICNPFGYEATCAHRALRHIADAAANSGFPAFRFDYDGTGDSAGDDRDPGRWDAWIASVDMAVDHLRQTTGVARVCLAGLRLGATLAALAAVRREDIAGLVAFAPVVSGKAWLRELRAFQTMMGFPPGPPGTALDPGDQEVAGFVLTAETQAAISRIDLSSLPARPADHVLILERDDLPADPRFAERLTAQGARVQQERLSGYPEMMRDAHESIVPSVVIEAVARWLEPLAVMESGGGEVASGPANSARVSDRVSEFPVNLGSTTMFGIVAVPDGSVRPERAILLLNSGAINHTGPSRLYTRLARHWAAKGHTVLRLDITGVGDSLPRPGERENVVYSEHAVEDVRLAAAYLRIQWGAQRVDVAGLCSGAYHGLKAAVQGVPFHRVAVVNPLTFFWKPGMSLAYPPYHVMSEAARYHESAFQLAKWKKLLSGRVNLTMVSQFVFRRVGQQVAGLVRNLGRLIHWPLADDLGVELATLEKRGVDVRFVFTTEDPGETLLRDGAGWALGRLLRRGRVHIARIAGPNHSFTPVWSQGALTRELDAALDIR